MKTENDKMFEKYINAQLCENLLSSIQDWFRSLNNKDGNYLKKNPIACKQLINRLQKEFNSLGTGGYEGNFTYKQVLTAKRNIQMMIDYLKSGDIAKMDFVVKYLLRIGKENE